MKTFIYLFIAFVLIMPFALMGAPDVPEDPNPVPLDGGLMALLAAGAVYGVKAYRKHNTPS